MYSCMDVEVLVHRVQVSDWFLDAILSGRRCAVLAGKGGCAGRVGLSRIEMRRIHLFVCTDARWQLLVNLSTDATQQDARPVQCPYADGEDEGKAVEQECKDLYGGERRMISIEKSQQPAS